MALPKTCTLKERGFYPAPVLTDAVYVKDQVLATDKFGEKIKYSKVGAGFSLIEVLVALTLFVILAGFSLTVSLDSYRSYSFRSQEQLLVSLLQRARAQSMGNINQAAHGLHIDSGPTNYILFQGNDFIHRDISEDLIFPGNPGQYVAGLTDIVFSQLSGTTTAGDIILKDPTHPQAVISLNSEGQINLH